MATAYWDTFSFLVLINQERRQLFFVTNYEGGNVTTTPTLGIRAHSMRYGIEYHLPLAALTAATKKLDRNALTTADGELVVTRRVGYGFVVVRAPQALAYLAETQPAPRPQTGIMPKHVLTLTRESNQQ